MSKTIKKQNVQPILDTLENMMSDLDDFRMKEFSEIKNLDINFMLKFLQFHIYTVYKYFNQVNWDIPYSISSSPQTFVSKLHHELFQVLESLSVLEELQDKRRNE